MAAVRRVFPTSLGEIWLRGEPEAFEPGKPRILALGGAFDNGERFNRLHRYTPGGVVVTGELPGNHCPELSEVSIEAYAKAYSEAVDHLGGPTLACGVSTGATVALAIRAANITAVAAFDPILRAGARLWPLTPRVRDILRQRRAKWADTFAWNVLGISATETADRDYSTVAATCPVPASVVTGEIPLGEERPLDVLPSLLGEPERAFLRTVPNVRVVVAKGAGHDIVNQAPMAVLNVLNPWVRATALKMGRG